MKTLIRFLFFAACIALFATCQKNDPLMDDLSGAQLKKAQPVTVTVPFKGDGYTTFVSITDDPDGCGIYPVQKIIAEGPCNLTILGKSIHRAEFCCNVESGVFWGGGEVLTAANGDLLFIYGVESSPIVPADENDPPYVAWKWDGKGIITGGTGRFEGASGEYMFYGYNSNRPGEENMSFHSWSGTLTQIKGKR